MKKGFTEHKQGPQPEDTIGEKVRVILGKDNYITRPISANQVDWDYPRDPVIAYQVVKEKHNDYFT